MTYSVEKLNFSRGGLPVINVMHKSTGGGMEVPTLYPRRKSESIKVYYPLSVELTGIIMCSMFPRIKRNLITLTL